MVAGILDAAGPLALSLAYVLLVGGSVRAVLARLGARFPRSLGLTAGIGMAVAALTVALAWRLADAAPLVVWPLAVLAAVALAAVVVPGSPFAPRERGDRRRIWADLAPHGDDVLAAAAAFVAVGPVFRHGLTAWTTGTNDFPSYVASVQVWTSKPTFVALHADPWGQEMVERAESEKPMATALLLAMERLGGTPVFALLTPVMLLGLGVLAATVLALVRERVPALGMPARAVALVPFFSVLPMARMFDAQVGQVLAATLAVVAVGVLARPLPATPAGRWGLGALGGVAVAACLGANVTLVLASVPVVVAAALWLALDGSRSVRSLLVPWLTAGVGALVLSVPLVGGYLVSLEGQTGFDAGFDVPLATPLALLGLQTSVRDTPAGGRAAFLWVLLLVVGVLASLALRRAAGPALAMIGLTALNGAFIVSTTGADGYGTHKWLAFAIWVVAPLVVVAVMEPLARISRLSSGVTALALLGAAAATCWNVASTVSIAVPRELLALAGDARLEVAETVNIGLGNQYESSLATLVLDRPTVLTDFSYADPAPRRGDWWLLRVGDPAAALADRVVPLNARFQLVDVDSEVGIENVRFDVSEPATRGLLSGRWWDAEGGGRWSAGDRSWITFEVAEELRSRDLLVTLTGVRFATPDHPRTLTLSIVDGPSATTTFTDHTVPQETSLVLPAKLVAARGGLLTLELHTPDPIVPATLGGADGRRLAYLAMSLSISPD